MSLRRIDVPALLVRLGIEARRRNRTLIARCPSPEHKDRSPSWYIRDEPGGPNHGWHYCYSCGFGGGLLSLVKAVLGIETEEAKGYLEQDKLPPPLAASIVGGEPIGLFALPHGVKILPLERWSTPPRRYVEARGIGADQVARWGLGYAVEGRLKGRIVIPVRDATGMLKGYTARAFARAQKRYLEPRSEEGADHYAIFGEQHWPEQGERHRIVLCEGSFDAMAVDCALGGAPVGAVFGSHVDPIHILKIGSFDEVLIASDPDEAGAKLTREIAEGLARITAVRFATIPKGHDPSSLFEEEGEEALRSALGEPADGYREAVPF